MNDRSLCTRPIAHSSLLTLIAPGGRRGRTLARGRWRRDRPGGARRVARGGVGGIAGMTSGWAAQKGVMMYKHLKNKFNGTAGQPESRWGDHVSESREGYSIGWRAGRPAYENDWMARRTQVQAQHKAKDELASGHRTPMGAVGLKPRAGRACEGPGRSCRACLPPSPRTKSISA